MKHYVYKYVLDDEVIYVGRTKNLDVRVYFHGKSGDNITSDGRDEINRADVYYSLVANELMADVIESELIRRYKPKYNKMKKSNWDGIDFVEPNWTRYVRPTEHKVPQVMRNKQAEYTKNNYTQIKLAMPNDEAMVFKEYCKNHKLKYAPFIRHLIQKEIESSKEDEYGVGSVAQMILEQKDLLAEEDG